MIKVPLIPDVIVPPTAWYLHKCPRYRWATLGSDVIHAGTFTLAQIYGGQHPKTVLPSVFLTQFHPPICPSIPAARREGSCVWTLRPLEEERSAERIQSALGQNMHVMEKIIKLLGPKDGLQLRTTSCMLNPGTRGTDTCKDKPLHTAEALEWRR